VLSTNSEITYHEPFVDTRDITLVGKAYFKVAKDPSRPFTVFSRKISTTALGTRFLVTAFEKTKQLTVQLYEGKIVVKSVARDDWRMKKDFYLKPGEKFFYYNDRLAKVSGQISTHVPVRSMQEETMIDDPDIPLNRKGSWYMFNNQSLQQVFDQLGLIHNVQIVYDKNEVRNKYFIGKFNKTDSLDLVLKYITIVNKLSVIKKEEVYYINKISK